MLCWSLHRHSRLGCILQLHAASRYSSLVDPCYLRMVSDLVTSSWHQDVYMFPSRIWQLNRDSFGRTAAKFNLQTIEAHVACRAIRIYRRIITGRVVPFKIKKSLWNHQKKQCKGAHMTQMISCSAQVCWGPLALAFSVQVSLALLMPPPKTGPIGGGDSSSDDLRIL